jgi:hypothetical protein
MQRSIRWSPALRLTGGLGLAVVMAAPAAAFDSTKGARIEACERVTCEVSPGITPGMPSIGLVAKGMQQLVGQRVVIHIEHAEGRSGDIPRNGSGGLVASDGTVRLSIAAHLMEPGRYRFTLRPEGAGASLASGRFIVTTGQSAQGGAASAQSSSKTPPAKGPKPAEGGNGSTPAAADLVGTWYGTATTVGQIEMKADGTYVFGGRPGGRYQAAPGGVRFTGALEAWNGGNATLKGGNLEFTWKNAEGAYQWFSFARR